MLKEKYHNIIDKDIPPIIPSPFTSTVWFTHSLKTLRKRRKYFGQQILATLSRHVQGTVIVHNSVNARLVR